MRGDCGRQSRRNQLSISLNVCLTAEKRIYYLCLDGRWLSKFHGHIRVSLKKNKRKGKERHVQACSSAGNHDSSTLPVLCKQYTYDIVSPCKIVDISSE